MNLETMKSQFTGDYRAAFDGAHKYTLTQSFPAAYSDDKMAELYDLLLTAQEEGKPAEKLVGTDIEAFCKEFFSDFQPEKRLAGILKSLFAVACVLVFFGIVDWLTADEVLPFTQFQMNCSPILCGLASGAVISLLFRAVQPLVMKTKKISAGGWAVIFIGMLIGSISAATILMRGKELSVPGAPVLIGAAAYILLYLAAAAIIRQRRTGSIIMKKQDNPYKDSYYQNLQDKDIRHLIEKGWLRRYRRLAKRGKTTAETFREEITRLDKINRVMDKIYTVFIIVIDLIATAGVAKGSTLPDTLIFFVFISLLLFLNWKLFHKADTENAAQRASILADCEASGQSLPEFLAGELNVTL